MDTDIDNYSYQEILNVLKLNNKFSIEDLYNNIYNFIEKIEDKYNNDKYNNDKHNNDKTELTIFFKNCFIKICKIDNLKMTKDMCLKLNIPNIINRENYNTNTINTVNNIKDYDTNISNFYNYDKDNTNNRIINNNEYNKLYNVIPDKPSNIPIPNNYSLNTFNNKFSKGFVNPLKIETITSTLIINSKFINSTNNVNNINNINNINNVNSCYQNVVDYTLELNEPYTNVVSLKLASVELINSYYPISDYLKTNYFRIIGFEYDPTSPTPETTKINISNFDISINDGSYTINELVVIINNLLSAITSPNSIRAINLNFNNNTGKLNFLLKSVYPVAPTPGYDYGFDIDFSIPFVTRPSYLNLGWLFGFSDLYYDFFNSYLFTANNLNLVGINSNFPVNLIGTSYFLIEVDDYNKNNPVVVNYVCDSPYSFNIKNILAKLPNTSSTNTLIFEDSSDRIFKTRNYFGPVRIKKLRIRLLDENGRVVHLNNSNFSLTLEIVRLN